MATAQYRIRPLADGDLSEWLRLRQLLWDQSTVDEHRSEMVGIIENAGSQFVTVADLGSGRLAGFLEASIRPQAEDCDTENVGYLEGWFVDEPYRQQGIGRRMVEAAENWARQRGCSEMASDAEINNTISQQAHNRLGYEETSRLVHLRKELK